LSRCYICGSLFSTDAPDCPEFNKSDPKQQKVCEIGEACLYYSWQKSDTDTGRGVCLLFLAKVRHR
jgi:hypothetical protein